MAENRIKIMLVSLVNRNYGDSVIADNTAFLIRKALGSRAEILSYDLRCGDVYRIRFCDAVVFAGGGLIKFRGECFLEYISEIVNEAQEHDIPVYFNSVGVEGYDDNDPTCQALKEVINLPCVKSISVRDDTELLKSSYLTRKQRVHSVIDPAVWCRQTYTDIIPEKSGYVGIGIAREQLFCDYGHSELDGEYMLRFWRELIDKLEAAGYKWRIFTNGLNSDEEFAIRVLRCIGHGDKLPQTMNSRELVRDIASFDAVIAQRMHSSIIAYSLGIPAVGIVWNDKMRFWGEKIGCNDRYILPDELSAERVFTVFENALSGRIKKPSFFLKRGVYTHLKRFVRSVTPRAVHSDKTCDFSLKLTASALGTLEHKFRNTNSLEAFECSHSEGFVNFEADIRSTSDGRAVCINGWSKDSLGKLGIAYKDEHKQGLGYEDFKAQSYYGRYKAADIDELFKKAEKLSAERPITMFLDIGKPPAALAEALIKDINRAYSDNSSERVKTVIRCQRESDVILVREYAPLCGIAYYLAEFKDSADREKKFKTALSVCRKYGIAVLSMKNTAFDEKTAKLCRENKLKAFVMSYSKAEDIMSALKLGAEYVGCHYLTPEYMNRLLK